MTTILPLSEEALLNWLDEQPSFTYFHMEPAAHQLHFCGSDTIVRLDSASFNKLLRERAKLPTGLVVGDLVFGFKVKKLSRILLRETRLRKLRLLAD